jgi:serine/threonine protein kinase
MNQRMPLVYVKLYTYQVYFWSWLIHLPSYLLQISQSASCSQLVQHNLLMLTLSSGWLMVWKLVKFEFRVLIWQDHKQSNHSRSLLDKFLGCWVQICRSLAHIHSGTGVCHRDIKPQNLLVLFHACHICGSNIWCLLPVWLNEKL